MRLIFEKHREGCAGMDVPAAGVAAAGSLPEKFLRSGRLRLPDVSEPEVVRHFTSLSRTNFSVDTHFYPLGSCTMKFNPRFTEAIAAMDAFTGVHPWMGCLSGAEKHIQGWLGVLYELEHLLCEITGMRAFTLQPSAGAHGELTGVMVAHAYHSSRGDARSIVLVPDSSHGTNPASAAACGYEVVVIPSGPDGCLDFDVFKEKISDQVAMVMLTCPNTLGIFNPRIAEICECAHSHGALMYYDGANFNAIMGRVRPGDVGFDIVHLNLHKTFATPHGGGGPGAGPVGVRENLSRFLPGPRVGKENGEYRFERELPDSIGQVTSFYGNTLVALKAYAYILHAGGEGLKKVSESAVLAANYVRNRLKSIFDLPYDTVCMHECVFSAMRQHDRGVSALDVAKYLIDCGVHPPTIYFPLIVREALMVEPTETESLETLDRFIGLMTEIDRLSVEDPQRLKDAPLTMPVRRLDEAKAARELKVRWTPET
jgi:glycine dehydrogenase subunit 2